MRKFEKIWRFPFKIITYVLLIIGIIFLVLSMVVDLVGKASDDLNFKIDM